MNKALGETPRGKEQTGPAATWRQRGAVTVEYALVMLIAAAILISVEKEVFRPMAKDILENFMECIVKPDP
jgi:hypothetical protein